MSCKITAGSHLSRGLSHFPVKRALPPLAAREHGVFREIFLSLSLFFWTSMKTMKWETVYLSVCPFACLSVSQSIRHSQSNVCSLPLFFFLMLTKIVKKLGQAGQAWSLTSQSVSSNITFLSRACILSFENWSVKLEGIESDTRLLFDRDDNNPKERKKEQKRSQQATS